MGRVIPPKNPGKRKGAKKDDEPTSKRQRGKKKGDETEESRSPSPSPSTSARVTRSSPRKEAKLDTERFVFVK